MGSRNKVRDPDGTQGTDYGQQQWASAFYSFVPALWGPYCGWATWWPLQREVGTSVLIVLP